MFGRRSGCFLALMTALKATVTLGFLVRGGITPVAGESRVDTRRRTRAGKRTRRAPRTFIPIVRVSMSSSFPMFMPRSGTSRRVVGFTYGIPWGNTFGYARNQKRKRKDMSKQKRLLSKSASMFHLEEFGRNTGGGKMGTGSCTTRQMGTKMTE